MQKEERVAILLATYNGIRFLPDLITSLEKQSYDEWNLYIRDDNSSDGTVDLLKEYEEKDDRIHVTYGVEQFGASKNFASLMNSIYDEDYVMFCDQDDVWLPQKIETTLSEMKNQERGSGVDIPRIVYSGKQLVNEDLRVLSAYKYGQAQKLSFHDILIQNPIYGCTMMINKAALRLAQPLPEYAYLHDYYLALLTYAHGEIFFVDEPLILYRQHDNNVTGGKKNYSYMNKLKSAARINKLLHQEIYQNYMFCKNKASNRIDGREYISMVESHIFKRLFCARRFHYKVKGVAQTMRLITALMTFDSKDD